MNKSISDYGIIGNMLSAALIGKDGSIDWCCLPRFDSPSVFAAILDDEKGGRFQIRPDVPFEFSQAYLPNTNILRTTFQTATGQATVTDFMPCYKTTRHRVSRFYEIHRLVDCNQGQVPLEVIFEPKLNYGRDDISLTASKHGITARSGAETLSLSSRTAFTAHGNVAIGRLTLEHGQRSVFILRYGKDRPLPSSVSDSADKLDRTATYWQGQAEGCHCSSPWRDSMVRSYLTLHLLLYSPTGAIIAAPTTSLPEEIGGARNWDYRFSWLRDTSLALNAFFRMGHEEETLGFVKWLVKVCRKCGPRTQILYNIDYENPPDEEELTHLKGYRESRPVRIGNDAYKQVQLDVFGEVLEAVYYYLNIGGRITSRTWKLLESFVNTAAELWQQPDNGIWEMRNEPRHFVHSKLMCWVALDRGIKVAESLGYKRNLKRWRNTAQNIKDDIMTRGWNSQRQSFTQHYDTTALDASTLLMPLYNFLPISDERIISTIERTAAELGQDGLLHRYRVEETDDGIRGGEGVFLWCSFWLVRNLIRLGRLDEARTLYEKLLGYRNHLGLFSEMVDPASGEALGNFPLALTHVAAIITGLELTQAVHERGLTIV